MSSPQADLKPTADLPGPEGALSGTLHLFVAFDWGDEVDLDHARRLVPAEVHNLQGRRRTPTSIAYRPPPLHFAMPPVPLQLPEIGQVKAPGGAIVFDFAAVSLALQVPFQLRVDALLRLAAGLADPAAVVEAARAALKPLHQEMLPAIHNPQWQDDLSEEYFVFQVPPGDPLPSAATLLNRHAGWLAGLVRLEAGPLSDEEVAEAVRLHLSYSPLDLIVPDWAAAVLLDRDCTETLQAIEFANVQLLEFRYIDNRLDDSLAAAYRVVHPPGQSWLPFWRSQDRPLRILGELKVEANGLFERTGNVLKLVGDQYLARVYNLVATRLHLDEWETSIQRKLEVAEGVYQVVSDQAATRRTEFLEMIVVLLILLEILLALFRH
jgi:hypothetical protein